MSRKAFILTFVVLCVVGLALFVLPEFRQARRIEATDSCVNNLRQIDGAKHCWMLEKGKGTNDVPSWNDLDPYLGRGNSVTVLTCPKGGVYTIGRVVDSPTCSIGGTHRLE